MPTVAIKQRQSARMSQIINDSFNRSGCTHMATVGVKGLMLVSVHSVQQTGQRVCVPQFACLLAV